MKKVFMVLIIFLLVISINVKSKSDGVVLNDVNTLNFEYKIKEKKLEHKIKIICSYDFCDYINGESLKDIIYNFEMKYLDTIDDIDLKNELKVKGVKITKVYLIH